MSSRHGTVNKAPAVLGLVGDLGGDNVCGAGAGQGFCVVDRDPGEGNGVSVLLKKADRCAGSMEPGAVERRLPEAVKMCKRSEGFCTGDPKDIEMGSIGRADNIVVEEGGGGGRGW